MARIDGGELVDHVSSFRVSARISGRIRSQPVPEQCGHPADGATAPGAWMGHGGGMDGRRGLRPECAPRRPSGYHRWPAPVPKDRPMQYRTLGRTGLKVSVAGFGAGGNSRVGQGRGLTVDQSVALLREAFDLGVNFVDTAEAYGTEEIVGQAVADRQSAVKGKSVSVRVDLGGRRNIKK